jgi:hypothetical protein
MGERHGKYLKGNILLQYPGIRDPVIELDTESVQRLPLGLGGWWE